MKVTILLYPGLTALDAIGPYEVFNSLREFEIQFAWKEVGPVVTDSGVLVLGATHSLDEISDCNILVVPGSGTDTLTLMADHEVLGWLQRIHRTTSYTTSVCSGALILGAAGLLKGLPATTHWAGMPILKQFGAIPKPQSRIVRNGKIITAAGVSAGIDLALLLISETLGAERAKIAQLLIEYDPQPLFNAGHMSKAEAPVVKKARAKITKISAMNPRNIVSVPKLLLSQWGQSLKKARK
ncbi:MAG: DJ-1/PfpI family protein [Xenococcaceae cyanobacterium MO_188.B32]|nr:DJ-1/PfpI family protein [Xenococcaceae cyanobacterium MO_188.B32]